jgi:hypothetical protein
MATNQSSAECSNCGLLYATVVATKKACVKGSYLFNGSAGNIEIMNKTEIVQSFAHDYRGMTLNEDDIEDMLWKFLDDIEKHLDKK